MYARAHDVLAGGVASSYQLRDPWPIYLERGDGPEVWDVDGNEMCDFHNGFGSMVQGHAHPAIGARRRASATRRARTSPRRPRTRSSSREELAAPLRACRRWRYTNSGSESTMDAIRIARALHRPRHGHEDLRLLPRPPRRGDGLDRRRVRRDRRPRDNLASLPYGAGIPQATVDLTHRGALQRRRARWSAGSTSSTPRAASPPA